MKRIEKLQNIDDMVGFLQSLKICNSCPVKEKCERGLRGCYELLKDYLQEEKEEKSPADLKFEELGYTKYKDNDTKYNNGSFFIEITPSDRSIRKSIKCGENFYANFITPDEYKAAMLKIEELKDSECEKTITQGFKELGYIERKPLDDEILTCFENKDKIIQIDKGFDFWCVEKNGKYQGLTYSVAGKEIKLVEDWIKEYKQKEGIE